jgi:hypothetical protein
MHSRKSDAHSLLLKNKKSLGAEFVLAKNDLAKDLPSPLQTKYFSQISVLFSFQESPRDDLFEEIKQTALEKQRISRDDINADKLTDLDVVRLALEYRLQGTEVILITDDEGIHDLVADLGKENELETLYTHLFFLKMMPYLPEKRTKKAVENNIQDSYYYLKNYLAKSERILPYEKVINTTINVLSRDFSKDHSKKDVLLQEKIDNFLLSGQTDSRLTSFRPLLDVLRKKRNDPDYPTNKACLDLLNTVRLLSRKEELNRLVVDLAHQKLASYQLELADINHKELNLVGALANVRAASHSLAFLQSNENSFAKTIDDLFFIEALLLLELGATDEALLYLEKLLTGNTSQSSIDYTAAAESLLVIYGKKKGLIKEQSAELLLALAKEAQAIPNPNLAKKILLTMLEDEKLPLRYKKQAASELIHLANRRLLTKNHPGIRQAVDLLGESIVDRTNEEPDAYHLQAIKEDFDCSLADPYKGPWEISEIIERKKVLRVYAWNNRLKSLWVLELPKESLPELEKAKTITFLSGKISDYKKPRRNEEKKFRRRILFEEPPVFVIDEKRALPLW